MSRDQARFWIRELFLGMVYWGIGWLLVGVLAAALVALIQELSSGSVMTKVISWVLGSLLPMIGGFFLSARRPFLSNTEGAIPHERFLLIRSLAAGWIWVLIPLVIPGESAWKAIWPFCMITFLGSWQVWWILEAQRHQNKREADLREQVAARSLPTLWEEMASRPEDEVWESALSMAAKRDKAVDFLKERLFPAEAGAEGMARAISCLDHLDPQVRDRASADLEGLGREAAPTLREALAANPTSETRVRLERLLTALEDPGRGFPETRRRLSAIRVLKRIATPKAREILTALGRGDPASRFTREALGVPEPG